MTRRPAFLGLPAVVVLAVAAVVALWVVRDDAAAPAADVAPLALTADGPTFGSVDELVLASDLAVVVEVTAVGPGRAIADPAVPEAGIITQLATADVVTSLVGRRDGESIVIEQEQTLLDGTPIIVNGLPPLQVGDRGVAFLVEGTSEEFPYFALVNEQAWLPLDDGRIASDLDDTLHRAWNGRSLDELSAALAG